MKKVFDLDVYSFSCNAVLYQLIMHMHYNFVCIKDNYTNFHLILLSGMVNHIMVS